MVHRNISFMRYMVRSTGLERACAPWPCRLLPNVMALKFVAFRGARRGREGYRTQMLVYELWFAAVAALGTPGSRRLQPWQAHTGGGQLGESADHQTWRTDGVFRSNDVADGFRWCLAHPGTVADHDAGTHIGQVARYCLSPFLVAELVAVVL
jgi:hypothetical protein